MKKLQSRFLVFLFCLISISATAHELNTANNSVSELRNVAPGNLASSPTLSFSSNTGFADNTISDGDGGSVPISDIDIQIYAINSSGTKLSSDVLEYHAADWGYPPIITYSTGTGYYGWTIKSSTGNNFSLLKLDFFDFGGWDGATFVAQAYDNGSSLGSVSFAGNTAASYVSLLSGGILTSIFGSVDEVRIYKQGAANSWIGLNTVKVTGPAATLPVNFVSFTASSKNGHALLQWQTSGEENAKEFIVQRSADGNSWKDLSAMAAAGSSSTIQNYRFTDLQPTEGNNYYRLLQIDLNGKSIFSEVRSVQFSKGSSVFTVLNNPVQNAVIRVQVNQAATFRLFNTDGKTVLKKQCSPGLQLLEAGHLVKGVYYLSDGTATQKIILQ